MSSFDTCTPDTCGIERSIFKYRPSLAANSIFIALFGICFILHLVQGLRWRKWAFMSCMMWGCAAEMIGYGGRIMMWNNVFDFTGFIMQIVCITIAPVFFSAAIYLTLYTTIIDLNPGLSRFPPRLYYIVFVVCDVISLVLQSVGGAMSTNSNGSSQTGVNIALAGLSFQVITLTVFIILSLDYALRYQKDVRSARVQSRVMEPRFKVFVAFLALATLCIFVRCVYRIAELSEGYSGHLLRDEGLFIGLEGVLVVVAAFALNVAHPGLVFNRSKKLSPRDSEELSVEKIST